MAGRDAAVWLERRRRRRRRTPGRAPGDEPDAGTDEITSMRATFPGWNVWRSELPPTIRPSVSERPDLVQTRETGAS
jgi:hypothetical protein